MEQYIPKSALVAGIEKIRAKWFGINNDFADGEKEALTDVLSLINTLEVKEVDLEKKIGEYLSAYWPNEKELHPFLGHVAKHFFELGMAVSNTLTWEDVEKIIKIHTDIYLDFFINDNDCKVDTKEYYQEVLKRFKEEDI